MQTNKTEHFVHKNRHHVYAQLIDKEREEIICLFENRFSTAFSRTVILPL